MDSPDHRHGHLDATTDREVVYCHACSNEWYRDEHGLQCPECESDITEIISPDNDPRELDHNTSASTSPEVPSFRFHGHDPDHDSDPDEADIEEHFGPHGFHFRRSTRDGGPGQRHHDPAPDPLFERFLGMIQDFAPPRPPPGSSPFHRPDEGRFGELHVHREPHIHRTVVTRGNTAITIVSGSPGLFGPRSPGAARNVDPFQAFFSNVLRDVGPPGPEGQEQPGPPPAFARGLQEILNLFNPANAVAGDAVYSQEALDQIITNLMEANPQSNAAPPASTEALANLDRRQVQRSMLEGDSKTECAICIDDMKENDMAAFLPCKHWFHEECVVLWLKEHNTCPVCRASIESNGGNSSGGGNNTSNTRGSVGRTSQPEDGLSSETNASGPRPIPVAGTRFGQFSRSFGQGQSRNATLRNMSSMQPEHEQERDRGVGTASAFTSGYDTSRLQRRGSRNSLSPTSPRMTTLADSHRAHRQRSPSQSSRRGTGNGESRRQSGSGPFNWFRDQFSSRGSSNQDSSRDER